MSASWGSPQCFWLLALAAAVVQTLTLVLSVVFFNRVLHTVRATFFSSCGTPSHLVGRGTIQKGLLGVEQIKSAVKICTSYIRNASVSYKAETAGKGLPH